MLPNELLDCARLDADPINVERLEFKLFKEIEGPVRRLVLLSRAECVTLVWRHQKRTAAT